LERILEILQDDDEILCKSLGKCYEQKKEKMILQLKLNLKIFENGVSERNDFYKG